MVAHDFIELTSRRDRNCDVFPRHVACRMARRKCRGVAPLEALVVFAAVLMPLYVFTLYCQCVFIESQNVRMSTRNETWINRFKITTSANTNTRIERKTVVPFNWSDANQGKLSGRQTKDIVTGLCLDYLDGKAASKHILVSGTWDHRDLDMNTIPNVHKIGLPMVKNEFASLMMPDLKSVFNDIVEKILKDQVETLLSEAKRVLDFFGNSKNDLDLAKENAAKVEKQVKDKYNEVVNNINMIESDFKRMGIQDAKEFVSKYSKDIKWEKAEELLKDNKKFREALSKEIKDKWEKLSAAKSELSEEERKKLEEEITDAVGKEIDEIHAKVDKQKKLEDQKRKLDNYKDQAEKVEKDPEKIGGQHLKDIPTSKPGKKIIIF